MMPLRSRYEGGCHVMVASILLMTVTIMLRGEPEGAMRERVRESEREEI